MTGAGEWPAPMDPRAFHGLAGDAVRLIEPHSEADPAALLVQLLVALGSAIGRGPAFVVEGDRHGANLYALIVGATGDGRKGTGAGRVRQVLRLVDPEFLEGRNVQGLSSGEGLIFQVRDPVEERRRARNADERAQADDDGFVVEVTDAGERDKRLLVVESEAAQMLRVLRREGSTLSPIIRSLWDNGSAGALTKNALTRTHGAHVSIVGHITPEELRRELTVTDAANGFVNRFLLVCSRRSKLLPDGGALRDDDLAGLSDLLRAAFAHARSMGELRRDADASELWREVYPRLTSGRPGLLGAVTGRAAAQVTRLSVVYALLDAAPAIRPHHLRAALAVWNYCARSAAFVFGDALGDPLADEVLARLRDAGPEGMSRTALRDSFARHKASHHLAAALRLLADHGLAGCEVMPTGGRPVELWRARAVSAETRSNGHTPRADSALSALPAHSARVPTGA